MKLRTRADLVAGAWSPEVRLLGFHRTNAGRYFGVRRLTAPPSSLVQ